MLSWADIRAAADRARSEHWPGGEIPVDIDLVLERMGIDIIPGKRSRLGHLGPQNSLRVPRVGLSGLTRVVRETIQIQR